jgi:predicted transcriptional regulator
MSDAEQSVLQALWKCGPTTVRDLTDVLKRQGKGWTRSTVITLLQRLEKKGYVDSDKSGFAFVFRAAVTREDIGRERLMQVADDLFGGSAAPLMLAFAEQHDFSEEELRRLQQLIAETAQRKKKRRKRG